MRLPLYAKILFWLFLNLVAVAAVVALLFNAQFLFNLDWLLASGARERIEAVRNLIVGELNTTPVDEWDQVIHRYNEAYHVRFAFFDDENRELIGDVGELPADVLARMSARPDFSGPQPFKQPDATAPVVPSRGQMGGFRRWRPSLRALLRTTEPTRYWLLATAWLDNPQAGAPMRVVFVAKANTLSGGGLVFDTTPWIILIFGTIIFSMLFWLPLARGITRAIAQITRATRQIADGRFDVRVDSRRRDELGLLGEAINQMAGRLDGFVSGQKRFLGDIAHELCSPLARLQITLGILEQRAHEDQTAYIRSASDKAEQIAALVGELLSFSKASFGAMAVNLQPVRIRKVVEEAVRREAVEEAAVVLDIQEDLIAAADPDLLIRAVGNLVRNAIRHAGSAAPITLSAARGREGIQIVVADCGQGVPESELPRIFDAFYRIDSSRTRETGGSGLGLAIVKSCVESMCGSVGARNRSPHGLEVSITLPVADSKLHRPPPLEG
ncbi:MAG: Signal transduction histidine kinase [Chthoniobacteraceae bacterium]|nr:Signal transduction histidine kinase [Chthoniobacteraceae bacterium]